MQRGYSFLMAGLLGLVVAPFPVGPAAAGCVGPHLEDVDRLVLRAGATASVEGRGFVDGCRDTQSCSGVGGCQQCEYDEPPEQPHRDIRLELRQDGRSWLLGTADAGTAQEQRLGWVTWTFDVPAGVDPGRAKLVAEGAQPVRVGIR